MLYGESTGSKPQTNGWYDDSGTITASATYTLGEVASVGSSGVPCEKLLFRTTLLVKGRVTGIFSYYVSNSESPTRIADFRMEGMNKIEYIANRPSSHTIVVQTLVRRDPL